MAGDESKDSAMERWLRRANAAAPQDCWLWSGHLSKGYGAIRVGNGERIGAHVFAWVYVAHRLIPAGMELDHLCRTPSCVNPAHLEPVTHEENLRRGESPSAQLGRLVFCARDAHPLAGANLYVRPNGKRECIACRDETRRLHAMANREQRNAYERARYHARKLATVGGE